MSAKRTGASNGTDRQWAAEIDRSERFAFGSNWIKFLDTLDDSRIALAEESLKKMLQVTMLEGRSFLDIGSGSGLFSLAARRLGAIVTSFDFDRDSVACTAELRSRYFPDDARWRVEQGSVLDRNFLDGLGTFDIVYSWGVLHHTGSMWEALEHTSQMVKPDGRLFIAIYNDQGRASRIWTAVKRAYVGAPGPFKWVVLAPSFVRLWGPSMIRDLLRGKAFATWRSYSRNSARGMHPWRDVVDWVGGYPFEVAKPEEIFDFLREKGFKLDRLFTCAGGVGCNEFVFTAPGAADNVPRASSQLGAQASGFVPERPGLP
jgi:2-polyprenyl-3-methyl-5-hydroxy-6-metoxy-1,4-benzoquinol methylase